MYNILGEGVYRNGTIVNLVSWFILLYAGFFMMPLVFLGGVHVKNFCNNRTTNERLSKGA